MAAKTYAQPDATVRVAESLANALKESRSLARRLTDHYFALDLTDCADTPPPDYVQTDANGNRTGHQFGPADFVNLVNLAQQYEGARSLAAKALAAAFAA